MNRSGKWRKTKEGWEKGDGLRVEPHDKGYKVWVSISFTAGGVEPELAIACVACIEFSGTLASAEALCERTASIFDRLGFKLLQDAAVSGDYSLKPVDRVVETLLPKAEEEQK